MFSIGAFSKLTGLTVKTLRFYHEKGILIPRHVETQTGYRYYDARQVETARIITQLRAVEFTLDQIMDLLQHYDDEADILDHLERQKSLVGQKVRQLRDVVGTLAQIIHKEKEARRTMQNTTFQVEEKRLEPMLIAGVRMQRRYAECGKGFAKIGKAMGWLISGKCFLLHYDSEYKEDADFEACMPIRRAKAVTGISVRELPGGKCVALLHQGPYEELARSYAKIMAYVDGKSYKVVLPTREVYLKGPGLIFKGNPKKYVTEIQMLVDEPSETKSQRPGAR